MSRDNDDQSHALNLIMKALHWAYDRAVGSLTALPPGDGDDKSNGPADRASAEDTIGRIIAWHATSAGCMGFATNIGGLTTLPVALPANLVSVTGIQLRMIAQIAQQRGYHPLDDRVRTLAFLCLCGTTALEEIGVKLGTQLTNRLIMQISGEALTRINQAVGFRLLTKAGTTGVVNLTKIIPFIGGIVGGGFDAAITLGIGEAAKAAFPRLDSDDAEPEGDADDPNPGPGVASPPPHRPSQQGPDVIFLEYAPQAAADSHAT